MVAAIAALLLFARSDAQSELPNRTPLPDRVASVRFTPLALNGGELGLLRLAGAWRVDSDEPTFFGLSALALRDGQLLALTDSGVTIDLPKPGGGRLARLHDLPTGPGLATYKKYRDSEGLLRAPDGGWLVTFEFRHSLWHYDAAFRRGAQLADLSVMHWPRNDGVEGLTPVPGRGLLLLPETTRGAVLLHDGRATLLNLAGRSGGLSDAVRLADGRVVVAVRGLGLGITNRLAWLEPDGLGYRLVPFATLPLGLLDNVEGLAAEPRRDGGTRLWAVTDNDGWRRTVLLALDLPRARQERR